MQAVDWALKVQFNQPNDDTRIAFERWLQADPANAAAWKRVSSVQANFKNLPTGVAKGVLDAVEKSRTGSRASRRTALKLLLLTAVVGPTAWVINRETPWQRLIASESTSVGEIRTIHLDDGTAVTLNTDTAISVAFEEHRREIHIHRGEILVSTGMDAAFTSQGQPKRPFWVATKFGMLQALGTRFIVRLDDDRARVSLQEGAIELTPATGGDVIRVAPGQTWWLYKDRGVLAEASGIGISEWADGLIVANDARLDDLAAEIARYRRGVISCDQDIAGLRVSGLYHLGDTDKTLRFLATTQPVEVRYMTRYWVRIASRQR
ncbi:FecR domain-containing protein [Herbaspirillum camelliae]|uniref:FecR domain-containing protein n=1 Tax=Herbaspirillum camelliae TaxID=1892903 RepID=UPI001E3A03E4|nr:FecR domain-containing protein [Herbaspirillum camelliae]